jgi:hypothetical protein
VIDYTQARASCGTASIARPQSRRIGRATISTYPRSLPAASTCSMLPPVQAGLAVLTGQPLAPHPGSLCTHVGLSSGACEPPAADGWAHPALLPQLQPAASTALACQRPLLRSPGECCARIRHMLWGPACEVASNLLPALGSGRQKRCTRPGGATPRAPLAAAAAACRRCCMARTNGGSLCGPGMSDESASAGQAAEGHPRS